MFPSSQSSWTEADTETEAKTAAETEAERQRQRDRETETQRDRETEKETKTESATKSRESAHTDTRMPVCPTHPPTHTHLSQALVGVNLVRASAAEVTIMCRLGRVQFSGSRCGKRRSGHGQARSTGGVRGVGLGYCNIFTASKRGDPGLFAYFWCIF